MTWRGFASITCAQNRTIPTNVTPLPSHKRGMVQCAVHPRTLGIDMYFECGPTGTIR